MYRWFCMIVACVSFLTTQQAFGAQPNLKLPFEAGETVLMSHGYYSGVGEDSHSASTDHYALDFISPSGGCALFRKPVVAVSTGVVTKVVRDKNPVLPYESRSIGDGYGNYVVLDHGDGYFSRYAHLDEVDASVELGETIIQGYLLGKAGDTGYAKGANCGNGHYGVHLHFALFKNGSGVKPEPMSGYTGFSNNATYTSSNDPKGWAKALISSGRWMYWKINPNNSACSAGSIHMINDSVAQMCIQATPSDCPDTPTFVLPADSAFGGGSESVGPIPITGGTNAGGLPNLIPNNSDIENASRQKVTTLHINEPGNCRMQTKNTGSQSAGFFQSRCYISDGSKIDDNPRDEGKEDTQGLGTGDTHTEHEDFTAPEYPGTYNAVWCTDSGQQVTESNEGDNCHVEDVFTVWSNPNVVTTSISLGGGRTTFLPGESFSADAVIANIGENFGKTILIGYYLDGVLVGTDRIKRENLKGGVSKVETLSQAFAPNTDGGHTFTVCADYGNRVQETNEADNCTSIVFGVTDPNPPIPPVQPALPAVHHMNPAVYQLLLD